MVQDKHRRFRGVRSKTTLAACRMGKMLGPGLGNCSILFTSACAFSTCLVVCRVSSLAFFGFTKVSLVREEHGIAQHVTCCGF